MSDRANTQQISDGFNLVQYTKNGDTCNILVLVHSDSYNQVQNNCNLQLLSGIFGEDISADKLQLSSYSVRKNGATVTLHFHSHADCDVTSDDVDLLLLFLPVNRSALHTSYTDTIRDIEEKRGESIWNNAAIVLTGVDVTLEQDQGSGVGTAVRLKELQATWKSHLQQTANSTRFQILLAGRQDQPDLPKPHQKWFSQLWFNSFRALNVRAMPAMLKFAQNRVSNRIASGDIETVPFYQQPIEIKEGEVTLPMSAKLGLGIGGGGAIAGATAAGATTGALIGALAIGIPSFGIAAGLGLLIGGVVGGGIGGGVATAAVGGAYHIAKNQQQQEIRVRNQKLYYAELLTRIPKISNHLNQWARGQTTCKIVVVGIKQEGVSTAAAAIAGQRLLYANDYYEYQTHERAKLVIRDFESFQRDKDREAKAKQLVKLMSSNDLLVFCVPMTSSKQNFVRSSNATYLQRLCALDKNILSHTVIALTHANEMQRVVEGKNEQPQISFRQFFNDEVEAWKTQIKSVLRGCNQSDDFDINGVPIIPVGASELSIDLSDNDPSTPATQYYWLSQFLINAMSATKPEGLPALIRINKRQVQQQPNEYPDIDTVRELITEAQCSMFSKIGLKEKKDPGEIIGVIMGMNDQQNW